MSSLIELAARRLEELQRAGVDIPGAGNMGNTRANVAEPPPSGQVLPLASAAAARAAQQAAAGVQAQLGGSSAAARAPLRAPDPARRLDIDLQRLAGMGYLVPSQAQSLLGDLMRVIKRPLLQNMRRAPEAGGPMRRGNVVVVTSAVAGEGKTFVSTNLAMSIAMEVDHAAVLIDGDVLRPAVFGRLNLKPQTGLMDVLLNKQCKTADVLVGTNVPKLSLMSSGTSHERAEELLASAAMESFLDELSATYHDRVIIIDSPPLLVTTESRVLAECAGQVILVVEADRTPREQIVRAFETLAECPIVMSVLNKSQAIEMDYAYGY